MGVAEYEVYPQKLHVWLPEWWWSHGFRVYPCLPVYPLFRQSHRTSFRLPKLPTAEVPCIRTCTDWAWKELWSLAVKTTELQIDVVKTRKQKQNSWREPLDVRGTHIQVHLSVLARMVSIAMKRFQQFQASPRRRQRLPGRWHDRSLLPPSYGFFIHTILALSAEDEEGNAMQGHPWHTVRTSATCQKTVKGFQTIGFPVEMVRKGALRSFPQQLFYIAALGAPTLRRAWTVKRLQVSGWFL